MPKQNQNQNQNQNQMLTQIWESRPRAATIVKLGLATQASRRQGPRIRG